MEYSSEIVVEFVQLILSQNRPMQSGYSPARNILLFDPLNFGNKIVEL